MKRNTKKHRGLWHLAKELAQEVPGTLQVDEDGRVFLELNGVLKGDAPAGMPLGQHRIVGELDDFDCVLLEDCFVTLGPHPFSRAPTQTWLVGEALFSVRCEAEEPLTLSGADFEITGLTKWARWTAFNIKVAVDETAVPEPQPLWKDDGVVVDLFQRVRRSDPLETTTVLEAPVTLRARGTSLSRDTLHDIATRPMQVLIALATGKFASISGREARVPTADDGKLSPPLTWLAAPLPGNLDPMRESFGFLYKDLRGLGPDALQEAYLLLKRLNLAIDLYLASLRDVGYAEVGFNLVAQALETYHRTLESSAPLSKPLWDELRKDLKATVEKHQNEHATTPERKNAYALISANLDHINQTSFRDRLRQLIEGVGIHASAICGGEIDAFLTSVVQTRNFYVHWHDKPGRHVVRGAGAVELKSRMLALLEITLLQALKFPASSGVYGKVLERRLSWLART